MSSSLDIPVGTELAGYQIEELAGRGGMGVVYRARDLALERPVALKLLSPTLAEDADFRQRFLIESRLAASLDHPNVIPVYDAGEIEGQLYLAMRYVVGSDLKEVLQEEGKLAPARAIAIVEQVAAALDAAHARGLVHRDVKPSNVLLDERGHAYLADFGLTRRLADHATGFDAGLSLGTPAYVAPEQIEVKDVDGRADQYSLACLLHEALTGQPPFPRGSEAAVLYAHLEERPPSPPGLEHVLPKALAKDPDERYPTCTNFVADARRALGLERRSLRWPIAVTAVGLALVAAALLAFFLTRGGSGSTGLTGRLVRIDAATNRPTGAVRLAADPAGVAFGAGHAWVVTTRDASVTRIDPKTLAVGKIPANGPPVGVAVTNQVVYVANGVPTGHVTGNVTRIDPESGAQLEALNTGGALAISGDPHGVWLATPKQAFGVGDVLRIEDVSPLSPSAGDVARIAARIPLRLSRAPSADYFGGVSSIASGSSGVWVVGDAVVRQLWRIDPVRRAVTLSRSLPVAPARVAVGLGAVWVTALLQDEVLRIDSRTGRVTATFRTGREPVGVAVGAGSVWVADASDGTVVRIDPKSGRETAAIDVGGSPKEIAFGGGAVWVAGDAD